MPAELAAGGAQAAASAAYEKAMAEARATRGALMQDVATGQRRHIRAIEADFTAARQAATAAYLAAERADFEAKSA